MFLVQARKGKSAYSYVADAKNITTTKSKDKAALWLNHQDAKNYAKNLSKKGWVAKFDIA
jgi:hypothetical protein